MGKTVAAVVVTYNRKELLVECLQALRAQSLPLTRIYIIDNASTDGTAALLDERGFISSKQIEYIRMERNTGGAGGFHAGLRRAYDDGYDWFWLMDDDVEPYQDALEKLFLYQGKSGCIHGRRRNLDGSPDAWGYYFDPETVSTAPIQDQLFQLNHDAQEVSVGCFEGMLISREVVGQIGFPDPKLFICGDDTYYGYMASRVTPVLYVDVYALLRKRPLDIRKAKSFRRRDICRVSPLSHYYFQRNRFLIAHSLKNRSFSFMWASLETLARSVFLEITAFGSARGTIAAFRGFWDGVKYYAKTGRINGSGCKQSVPRD